MLLMLSLLLASCNKDGEDSGSASNNGAAASGTEPEEKVELAEQQQAVPDPEQFRSERDKTDDSTIDTEIPASWPAELALPDGAEIKMTASRNQRDVVEFKVSGELEEIAAFMAARASMAGYTLREADVDKFTRTRKYTQEDRELTTQATLVENEIHASMIIGPTGSSRTYSSATHYHGEFSLPGSWPSDILPVYEGSVLREMYVPLEKGGRLMMSAQTTDSEDAVIAWMDSSLPGMGWTETNSFKRNGFSVREYEGNGYTLSAAARGSGGVTDIQFEANSI